MKAKIVFLVMSAVSKPETVDQLARALAPHTVLVHHDFSQTPEFALNAPNVRFVPGPKRTGWGVFGFVEGVFHAMQYALGQLDFDYLQLLSPTCLPIKPIKQFETHVSGRADAHFDCVDVLNDQDALMSIGYRAFTPDRSLRFRLASRLSSAYFGSSAGRRDEAGIWLHSGGSKTPVSWLALQLTRALSRPTIGRHIFDENFRAYYGAAWFGARRHIIAGMVESFRRPRLRRYFSRLRISEEILIPTLLMHLRTNKGPMNHCMQLFDEAHTGVFDEENIELLKKSPAYFARKFPDDPGAPIRTRVLAEMVGPRAILSEVKNSRSFKSPGPGRLVAIK
jgi:hypothetical protein